MPIPFIYASSSFSLEEAVMMPPPKLLAQIDKACEPVFTADGCEAEHCICYVDLIVGVVGLACIKKGKSLDIKVEAFLFASTANATAALKGNLGSSVPKSLKADPSKNMDAANVYAVMNIISCCCSIPFAVVLELPTLSQEWTQMVDMELLHTHLLQRRLHQKPRLLRCCSDAGPGYLLCLKSKDSIPSFEDSCKCKISRCCVCDCVQRRQQRF
jgi:hypothetical protein